jgi:hypothetical protein
MLKLATPLLSAIMLAVATGSASYAADAAQMEANKKAVVDFYEKGLNQKDSRRRRNISAPITSSTIRWFPMACRVLRP